jgi:hypothetical protein
MKRVPMIDLYYCFSTLVVNYQLYGISPRREPQACDFLDAYVITFTYVALSFDPLFAKEK